MYGKFLGSPHIEHTQRGRQMEKGLLMSNLMVAAWFIYTAEITGKQEQRIAVGRSPSWSPDGMEIVFVSLGKKHEMLAPNLWIIRRLSQLHFFDIQTRVEETFLPNHHPNMYRAAWSPLQ